MPTAGAVHRYYSSGWKPRHTAATENMSRFSAAWIVVRRLFPQLALRATNMRTVFDGLFQKNRALRNISYMKTVHNSKSIKSASWLERGAFPLAVSVRFGREKASIDIQLDWQITSLHRWKTRCWQAGTPRAPVGWIMHSLNLFSYLTQFWILWKKQTVEDGELFVARSANCGNNWK